MIKVYLSIVLVLSLSACGQTQEKDIPKRTLVKNVHVVDVLNGTILENQNIVVGAKQILEVTEVLPSGEFQAVIDGDGAYVVPGLTEMHAHIPSPPTSQERIEEILFLYLSGGITTIRGMLGHPDHLKLREEVSKGTVLGPRIYTSSPSLNGNTVRTGVEAVEKVTQYASEGYDFLKIHPGIRLSVFDSLVSAARLSAIPFAGHVPVEVGVRHALESGYATIDHVDGYLEGLVPADRSVDPASNGFFGFNFTKYADTNKIDDLVRLTRKQKVWVVPTQTLFERWFAPTDADSLLAQPEMKYMTPATLKNWKRVKEEQMNDPSWDPKLWVTFDAIRQELIRELARNGQGLLLGSDAPQLFNVPGFSLHREMASMHQAGLTPLEILRMGTYAPAQFFGAEADWGTVEAGKAADFFLVRENPLEDVGALKGMTGLMLQGKWLTRNLIDQKLEEIASNSKAKNE
ncbi:amidohydrolase family protein [Robiginitalea aurantiaca]|uniref:Amidohydrolase family protein n=1 Tax=Robiginitalea aurantiaca TaxID=3056915 RepID=A0ABT7WCG3_9FLAO|nr:amidohydrolase family protein [Robiginitalea aurantiaca]MDM9630605.1 amidohydrolase family protein [Robiginitalea aurantiaca]